MNSNLLHDALLRLKVARDEDRAQPWHPGKEPSDATLILNYIQGLRNQLDLARDEAFLHQDQYWATGNPYHDREAILRAEQGIFG
jgi:hypothetical protein